MPVICKHARPPRPPAQPRAPRLSAILIVFFLLRQSASAIDVIGDRITNRSSVIEERQSALNSSIAGMEVSYATVEMLRSHGRLSAIMVELGRAQAKAATLLEEANSMLRSLGCLYRMAFPPKRVGIHPANRDAYGVSATEVLDLGLGSASIGFSFPACAAAAALTHLPDMK